MSNHVPDVVDDHIDEPRVRQTEVIVAHRIGYWCDPDLDMVTTEMIAEADAYLEAHIQWRMATHDAELTEKVRRATLDEAEKAILDASPPINSELSMRGGEGPFVDRGMESYIEGFHDAYVSIRALSATPTEGN